VLKMVSKEIQDWYDSRPEPVKKVLDTLKVMEGYTHFQIKETGQIGSLRSVSEEGTVSIVLPANEHNVEATKDLMYPQVEGDDGRLVFGIDPHLLTPLDTLPYAYKEDG